MVQDVIDFIENNTEIVDDKHTGSVYNLVVAVIGIRSVLSKDRLEKKFVEILREDYEYWLDGNEHSYVECSGDVGDEQLALRMIGLGCFLGLWDVVTPYTILGTGIDSELARMLAKSGMILFRYRKGI